MTVSYTAEVANASVLGCFFKLLLRWRGSIYKIIWKELVIYLCIYYMLNLTYQFLLNKEQQRTFENVVIYCKTYGSIIPLSFVLGFYVSNVMARWWDQYNSIPTPDSAAIFVASYLIGTDDRSRIMRRTIMRYMCLSLTIVLSMVAPRVKRRFPTLNELRFAGLLLSHEQQVLEDMESQYPLRLRHWLPLVWATTIVTRARNEGRIREDYIVRTIVDELNAFRSGCGALLAFDSVTIPLVYTQVVTLAVYSYFICQVIGHQWLLDGKHSFVNMHFPIFLSLQFFFYMGWLKVAESMINPFGDDDNDFEVNWMVDRNLQVAYLIVDEMYGEHPDLTKDKYWDDVVPIELPYSEGVRRDSMPPPSTDKLDKPHNKSLMKLLDKLRGVHAQEQDDLYDFDVTTLPMAPYARDIYEDGWELPADDNAEDPAERDWLDSSQSNIHPPNPRRGQ